MSWMVIGWISWFVELRVCEGWRLSDCGVGDGEERREGREEADFIEERRYVVVSEGGGEVREGVPGGGMVLFLRHAERCSSLGFGNEKKR